MRGLLFVVSIVLLCGSASARPVDQHCVEACAVAVERTAPSHRVHRVARYSGGEVVAHPAGCPRRAFCGCGAALYVFGKHVRSLWLAANWLGFPSAAPGPGMVAARRGHVMVILEYYGDGTARVYDANSGGRLTRIHRRSLAGYRVVNPRSA